MHGKIERHKQTRQPRERNLIDLCIENIKATDRKTWMTLMGNNWLLNVNNWLQVQTDERQTSNTEMHKDIGMEKRKTNFVWNDWSTKGTKFTVWKQHSQSTEKYLYTRHCQTTVKNVNTVKKKVLYRYVGLHSWIALVYGSQRTS